MELNHEKCQCERDESGGGFVWCCHGLKGQGSGLLAAPLTLHGPPEELLYMPGHVHGVVQVEVSIRVQHTVVPVTGHRALRMSSLSSALPYFQNWRQLLHSICLLALISCSVGLLSLLLLLLLFGFLRRQLALFLLSLPTFFTCSFLISK